MKVRIIGYFVILLLLGFKFYMSFVNNFGKIVWVVLWKFNGRLLINRFDKKNIFKI